MLVGAKGSACTLAAHASGQPLILAASVCMWRANPFRVRGVLLTPEDPRLVVTHVGEDRTGRAVRYPEPEGSFATFNRASVRFLPFGRPTVRRSQVHPTNPAIARV
jgi:hypothetical protein